MRVVVDEPGRDDAPVGIDDALGRGPLIFPDPDDFPLMHRNIRLECRLTRAIHDASIVDEQVICHDAFSSLPRSG
jgi:hypothetical protein